jgi:hypothetical protein
MDLKVGDRVSFLNEKGGGVVVSIKDKHTVLVSEDDGFTTPYSIKQLVKVHQLVTSVVQDMQLPVGSSALKQIALLYVPKDNTNIMGSDLDLFLVNHSGVNFYFELYQVEAGKALLFSSGQLSEGMTHLIVSFKRELLEVYTQLRFQCLFNANKKMEPMQPFAQHVSLKANKFYKNTSFSFSPFVSNIALCYLLASEPEIERLKQAPIELIDEVTIKEKTISEKVSKPHHYHRKEEEVDLHISEILEDQMGVSNMQLLQIQLNTFKKELEKAIQLNYASITFIHGIGKGVLKQAILIELEGYSGIKFYPASFQKYGSGATKVEIL